MSARGRGGKFSKPKRGGGKHFSRNLRPLNADGEVESMWGERGVKEDGESSDEEEDSSEESSSEEEAGPAKPEMTREERRAAARKRKEAAIAKQTGKKVAPGDVPSSSSEEEDEDMPANPNHTAKAQKQASATPVVAADAPSAASSGKQKASEGGQLSRREREALQAQAAKERYQRLHAEGKTDEARADLERLKLVKERREEDAARKKAEAEEKSLHEKDKSEQMARMERQANLKSNKLGNKKKK